MPRWSATYFTPKKTVEFWSNWSNWEVCLDSKCEQVGKITLGMPLVYQALQAVKKYCEPLIDYNHNLAKNTIQTIGTYAGSSEVLSSLFEGIFVDLRNLGEYLKEKTNNAGILGTGLQYAFSPLLSLHNFMMSLDEKIITLSMSVCVVILIALTIFDFFFDSKKADLLDQKEEEENDSPVAQSRFTLEYFKTLIKPSRDFIVSAYSKLDKNSRRMVGGIFLAVVCYMLHMQVYEMVTFRAISFHEYMLSLSQSTLIVLISICLAGIAGLTLLENPAYISRASKFFETLSLESIKEKLPSKMMLGAMCLTAGVIYYGFDKLTSVVLAFHNYMLSLSSDVLLGLIIVCVASIAILTLYEMAYTPDESEKKEARYIDVIRTETTKIQNYLIKIRNSIPDDLFSKKTLDSLKNNHPLVFGFGLGLTALMPYALFDQIRSIVLESHNFMLTLSENSLVAMICVCVALMAILSRFEAKNRTPVVLVEEEQITANYEDELVPVPVL